MSVPQPVREDGPLARGRAALASGRWEAARTAFGESLRDSPSAAATRQATEADGRWPVLRDALTSFFERHSTRDDRLTWPAGYLVGTGRKRR